ncbi:unnamed protein product, partial [marine sediment metagenome]
MRCEDVRVQLLDVADGAEMSQVLSEHLETCRDCSEHLRMLRRHRELLGMVPSPSAPVEVWQRIQRQVGRRQWTWVGQAWWAAAAAVVLVAAGLSYMMLTPPVEETTPVLPVAGAPMNGKSVDYLVTRH